MRVGFECSNLYPHMGGVFTYGWQLLWHLARLDDPPELTFIDAQAHRGLPHLLEANNGLLPTTRYVEAREWPYLHRIDGPWQKRYRSRHAAIYVDAHALRPLWQVAERAPFLAGWRLPRAVLGRLDVCHWPFEAAFINLPRVAHVATIHDLIVLRHPEWLTPSYVEHHTRNLGQIARYATRLIADSENTRGDIVALLDVSPSRIDVVPLAANPDLKPPANPDQATAVLARYGLQRGEYIFSWGIISERKNYVRLATAFKVAIERNPALTTRLVLAGDWGWMTEPIKEGLATLGLGERLAMPGRVPQTDLPALLHGARAVAYLSLYEGFGLPPLEAMACGAPVVASNTSSIPEVVGDAGLLVDPREVGDIAEALGRVMGDDALRADLAARGLRRAEAFSWEKTAALTLQTYRRAVEAKRKGRR